MNRAPYRFRPRLERLENRDNPSNLTVAFSNHTLTIKGATVSTLTVEGNAGDKTQFAIASSGGDTFNSNPSPYSSPTGVQNITFDLSGGSGEVIDFDDAVTPIILEGNLTVSTGPGNNTNAVEGVDLTVQKNITITTGANSSESLNEFTNLNVGGSLTIHNGNGNATNWIIRSSAGISSIGGNLIITNNGGEHFNSISDLNIGGSVAIINGTAGSNAQAGYTQIYNVSNTGFRSVIRGNLTVTYVTGNGAGDVVLDTTVGGNVTFHHGTGNFTTYFDGFFTGQPDSIGGSLTMTGSGADTVSVGSYYEHTGLIVGKNLTIAIPKNTTGGDTLTFNRLLVGGNTILSLLSGSNTVTVDQSQFAGTFTLSCGPGNDTLSVEATAGDTLPTEFDRAVVWILGGGSSSATIATGGDVIFASTVVFKGWGIYTFEPSQVDFLFGGSL